jgi:hypothetical protein
VKGSGSVRVTGGDRYSARGGGRGMGCGRDRDIGGGRGRGRVVAETEALVEA